MRRLRIRSVLQQIPLDEAVAMMMKEVSREDIPDLPDRVIAATALLHSVPVLSRDGRIRSGYDVFLTADQGIPHQQNLAERRISVVVIRARTNQLEDLLPAVGGILLELAKIQSGEIAIASGTWLKLSLKV